MTAIKRSKKLRLVSVVILLVMFGGMTIYTEMHRQKIGSIVLNTSRKSLKSKTLLKEELSSTLTNKTSVAILAYVSPLNEEIQVFLTMLHGSWRYITDHQDELSKKTKLPVVNNIHLIAFCVPDTCRMLEPHCVVVKTIASIPIGNATPKCWAVEQVDGFPSIMYPPLNSYVMFNRSDASLLVSRYEYLMRTDYDVFISPSLLWHKPNRTLSFGIGGYGATFNKKRLPKISAKLGLVHRNISDIGSTWFGETDIFLKAGKKMLEVTEHLYLNEFQPNMEGLQQFHLDENPDGIWPDWYKPVSTMYAGEIVLNHLLTDIGVDSTGSFDDNACSELSIWTTMHIHCWHNECEFNKFIFKQHLFFAIASIDENDDVPIPSRLLHTVIEGTYPKDISEMKIHEYATYIAWNSAGRYLKKWFQKPNTGDLDNWLHREEIHY